MYVGAFPFVSCQNRRCAKLLPALHFETSNPGSSTEVFCEDWFLCARRFHPIMWQCTHSDTNPFAWRWPLHRKSSPLNSNLFCQAKSFALCKCSFLRYAGLDALPRKDFLFVFLEVVKQADSDHAGMTVSTQPYLHITWHVNEASQLIAWRWHSARCE